MQTIMALLQSLFNFVCSVCRVLFQTSGGRGGFSYSFRAAQSPNYLLHYSVLGASCGRFHYSVLAGELRTRVDALTVSNNFCVGVVKPVVTGNPTHFPEHLTPAQRKDVIIIRWCSLCQRECFRNNIDDNESGRLEFCARLRRSKINESAVSGDFTLPCTWRDATWTTRKKAKSCKAPRRGTREWVQIDVNFARLRWRCPDVCNVIF
jgi:hypothetical protein